MNIQTVKGTMIQWVCPECETVYFQFPKKKEEEFHRNNRNIEKIARSFLKTKHTCK